MTLLVRIALGLASTAALLLFVIVETAPTCSSCFVPTH